MGPSHVLTVLTWSLLQILSERESLRKGQIDAEIESLKATFTEQVNDLKREQKKRSKTWRKDMEEMRSAYERQLSEVRIYI